MQSLKLYVFLLPLAVLFTPDAVNAIFPGVYITAASDSTSVLFSIVTHVDIYLLLGYLRYGLGKKREGMPISNVAVIGVFLYTLMVPVQLFVYDRLPILAGICQLRYAILILLIAERRDLSAYFKAFTAGTIASIFCITMEACVFTHINHLDRLTSGNFGVNGLGHLMTALAFISYFGAKAFSNKIYRAIGMIIAPAVAVGVMYASGTRGAMVAGAITILILAVLNKRRIFTIPIIAIAALLAVTFWLPNSSMFQRLTSGVSQVVHAKFEASNIDISDDTTSMVSRLTIWAGTLHMISDNLVIGVGPAVWNSLKGKYGVPYSVLLDPHDDYLSMIASYGVIFGFGLILLLYVRPIAIGFSRLKKSLWMTDYRLWACMSFLVSSAISSVSNANLAKHQIFAIAIVVVVLFYGVLNRPLGWNTPSSGSLR